VRKFLLGLVALSVVTTGLVFAADVGPKADVAAVRAAQLQKIKGGQTGDVHVVGNYALVQWYWGEASGAAAFKRSSGERWSRILAGGGASPVVVLVAAGIPASIARQLCSGWPQGHSPC
jgi:hypothetical protein